VLAIFDDLHAIDEDVLHSNGVLMRFVKGRTIRNHRRIEHKHVGETFPPLEIRDDPDRGSFAATRSAAMASFIGITFSSRTFCLTAVQISIGARMWI